MGISRAAFVVGIPALLLVAASTSCLDPTQITVDMSTDVKCSGTKGTSISAGAPGTLDVATPTTTTNDCTGNGHIGTIVSFPSASKDSDAAFLVVTGVDRPVSECTPANDYEGCIVQRRLIHYVKHTPLNLPITMWLVCKNVKCNVDSTCARTGKCVSARIEDPEACAGGDCYPEGDKPPAPGDEAGATDGPTEDGPTEDGPIGDGGPGDAKPDSITDANKPDAVVIPPLPPGNNLFCPPLEAGCAPAGVCCYSRTGSGGMCGPPACNGEQITMHCSRKADCPGAGEFCCGALGAVADPIQVELAQQPGKPANQLVQTPVPVGSGLVSTSCAATCPSTTTGRWVCVVGEGGNCPAGLTCQNDPSAFYQPSAFGTCSPP